MKKMWKVLDSIIAFVFDTIMAWLFAIMLLVPIFGTVVYRNVRRIVNVVVKISKLSEKPNLMTVDEYMEKRRK